MAALLATRSPGREADSEGMRLSYSRMASRAFHSGVREAAALLVPMRTCPPRRRNPRAWAWLDPWKGLAEDGDKGVFMESAAAGPTEPTKKLAAASIGGAVAAAFAASLCCLGPLVFAALGIGGAGLLVRFEAYRPYLATLTVLLLGAGFYLTYRRPRSTRGAVAEAPACDCERPTASRLGPVALWVATVVVVLFLGFPYLAEFVF